MRLEFEWDSEKERKNIIKHGIDFETAKYIFDDYYRIEILDASHSSTEEMRYITIGRIKEIITVVYTERNDKIRIISARTATKEEKELYYYGSYKEYS